MTAAEIANLFTGPDGTYRFARWGRSIAPVVFGVDDATLPILKGAIEAVVTLARHRMAETDPELGANLMLFFVKDWDELEGVPDLGRLVGDVPTLVARLSGSNQYRTFRFEEAGSIKACFSFVRLDEELAAMSAEAVALSLAVSAILCWSERAFAERSALAEGPEGVILNPEVAEVIRASYDPVMPSSTTDASHALRLAARIGS